MANYQVEEMDKVDKARKAYSALDYFNDMAGLPACGPDEKEAKDHLDNLYAIVKAYEGKTETPQEKSKPLYRFVMTIGFHTIPKMGDGTQSKQAYFNELAERHNAKRGFIEIHVTAMDDAHIYYYDRKDADAILDELHKDNVGPFINMKD